MPSPQLFLQGPLRYAEACVCTEGGGWAEPIDEPVLCTQGPSRLQNSFPEESGRNKLPVVEEANWVRKRGQDMHTEGL